MLPDVIILQSAGSLSVAILALLMLTVKVFFFIKKTDLKWYAWSSAISFSALMYSVGIFFEYNTPQGPLNRFSGLLEFTAIVCWVHSLYGFTFSYLGIKKRWYHPAAGVFHGLVLILLWFTHLIVAEGFTTRRFMGLTSPFVEPALGPLGPIFVLYAVGASVRAMIIWIRSKDARPIHRRVYLAAWAIWIVLGVHDGLAAVGFPAFQYMMEYGFLAFSLAALWVAFSGYLDRVAEEKYRIITELANDCIVVIQDGNIVYRNPACDELTGRSLFQSTARDLLDVTTPKDHRLVFDHYRPLLRGNQRAHPVTVSIQKGDGEKRVVEITSSLIRYRGSSAILSIMRDITERKAVEDELRESEEKYRSMMEAMQNSVYIASPDFRIVYMNPSMIKMIGGDETGKHCYQALFGKDKPCPWCVHESVQRGDIIDVEMTGPIDKRSYHVTYSPIFHKDGSISTMVIYRDITLTKHLQNQVLRSERLSATGHLAAAIAHEINSPLQGIASLLHSIERSCTGEEKVLKKLSLVRGGFMSIRDTVKKLLDLTRPGKEPKQLTDINSLIRDTAALLKSLLEKNQVQIELKLSSAIPHLIASPQQLGQVLMNLINNAVEVMAGIAGSKNGATPFKTSEKKVIVTSRRSEDAVSIQVADTGPGISKEDMGHIFDPFYTRKREMGMGIGLSLCQRIIEDHNGSISASNDPAGGAVFTIRLPLS